MNIPAPGDLRNCMSAITRKDDILSQLLQYRFGNGDLSGHSLGNLIISALIDIEGDIGSATDKLSKAIGLKAKIMPVTTESTQICAELENGEIVEGEFEIIKRENNYLQIVRLFHNPPVKVYKPCVDAIENADVIVMPHIWAPYVSGSVSVAIAHGLPMVTTNVGSIWEYVGLFKTGEIIKPGSSKAIADGIRKVFKDYNKYKNGNI